MQRVCVVGSGSWGTVVAKLLAENSPGKRITMWCFEEALPDGSLLSDAVNSRHENPKYLPGIHLPDTVVAVPDLVRACEGATHLVFVVPHQFLAKSLATIAKANNTAKPLHCISLIKGLTVDPQSGPVLLSSTIEAALSAPCAVLMGANVATEVAEGQFCEATVGSRSPTEGAEWARLFHQRNFRISVVPQVAAVEMLGALKNIVALGAGISDGLGAGGNSKAAIMRIGFAEMRHFIRAFGGEGEHCFWESCGIADLITTCIGGRNRRVAETFAKEGGKRSFAEIEKDLGGQLLQGTGTLAEVVQVLRARNTLDEYPLFKRLHAIVFEGVPPNTLFDL